MTVKSLFEMIEALPSSEAFRESEILYPYTLAAHILSMCLFAGLILMMDLRLAGFGFQETSFSELQKRLFPWQMVGLIVSTITGGIIFYGQPVRYYGKILFWSKLALMVLAALNAAYFHVMTYRSVAKWDRDAAMPLGCRVAGIVSLVLWAGVIICGRLVAYNWLTYE